MPSNNLPRIPERLREALLEYPKASQSQLARLDSAMKEAGVKFVGRTERNWLVALRIAYVTNPERFGIGDPTGIEVESDVVEGAAIRSLPNGGFAVDMNGGVL